MTAAPPEPVRQAAPVLIGVEQLRRKVPGGIGTAAAGLLKGLAATSAPTRSAVVLYASAPSDTTAKVPSADPLWAYDLPILISPLPSWLLVRLWAAGRAAPPHAVSLVHATSFQYPPSPAPLVSTVHDLAWRHTPDAYGLHGRRWHEAALARVARNAAAFVVPSEDVADDLASSGHRIDDRPVEVIPWGSDHLPDPDERGCDDLLRSLGVDGPFLLSVSTIQPRKNLARLIEAFGLARAALAGPMTLLVVGPDGWGGGVRAGEGVVLAGRVDEAVLAALYRRAVLFLFVSLSEGFGLPVVEAMHAGTAVLSSDVPSAGRSTLLVDPLDLSSIRDGIVDLVSDDAARAALAEKGRATAAARTWSTVALRHLELWQSLGAELPAP